MKLQASAALLLMAVGSSAMAQELDLSMSDDTALLKYSTPISYSAYGQTDASFGFMYTEVDDMMVQGGIEMKGEAGSQTPGLVFGMGIRAYGIAFDEGDDISSLTIGASMTYVPPQVKRLGLVAEIYYGPDVTTSGDADRFSDFNLRAEYEMMPEAAFYIGYRNVQAELVNNTDVELDKGGHVGLRMSF